MLPESRSTAISGTVKNLYLVFVVLSAVVVLSIILALSLVALFPVILDAKVKARAGARSVGGV